MVMEAGVIGVVGEGEVGDVDNSRKDKVMTWSQDRTSPFLEFNIDRFFFSLHHSRRKYTSILSYC
jgi:hypothetical protein